MIGNERRFWAVIALMLTTGCASMPGTFGRITVGDSKLWYDDVCSQERTKCSADGYPTVILKKDRPNYSGGDPAEFLGSLVQVANVRDPLRLPCARPTIEDYELAFERPLKASVLAERTLENTIDAAVKGSIPAGLKEQPGVEAELKSVVRSALLSNAYTDARYVVYTLKSAFLNKIVAAAEGPMLECKNKLKAGDGAYGFVWSIAVLESSGKLKRVQSDQVQAAITASLTRLQLNGASVQASAAIASSIVVKVETTVDAEVKNHSKIYSYGFWTHHLNAGWAEDKLNELKFDDTEKVMGLPRAL